VLVDLAGDDTRRGNSLFILREHVGGDDPLDRGEPALATLGVDFRDFVGGLWRDHQRVYVWLGDGEPLLVRQRAVLDGAIPLVDGIDRLTHASDALVVGRHCATARYRGHLVSRHAHEHAIVAVP